MLHRDTALGDEPAHVALAHTEIAGGLRHTEQRVHEYVYAGTTASSLSFDSACSKIYEPRA